MPHSPQGTISKNKEKKKNLLFSPPNSAISKKKPSGQWYEMQDLTVKQTVPQLITLSEAYFQIWEYDAEASKGQ
jgi:hypothetical protein